VGFSLEFPEGMKGIPAIQILSARLLGQLIVKDAIAACHALARVPEETDWARIVALYDSLAQLTPCFIVELNRAVAVGMAACPQAALSSLKRWPPKRRSKTNTYCRACAASFSQTLAAAKRRAES
jgi:predicted RNA polymerase sigma factor